MHDRHAPLSLLVLALLAPPGATAEPGSRHAPIPRGLAVSQHAPFVAGDCGVCHQRDRGNPGPLVKPVPGLCLDCHEDYADRRPNGIRLAKTPVNCTWCHTPHNSEKQKLLL